MMTEAGRQYLDNATTEAAMREAEEIITGRKQAKRYSSFDELVAELDADD